MIDGINISGFSDEICESFDEQLRVVKQLGMRYVSLRTADGKSIADYTLQEAKELLLPRLEQNQIKVSSLGSPIGKIQINDDEAFAQQLKKLENLCNIAKLLSCRFIRIFSFFMPKDEDPSIYGAQVIAKLKQFEKIARSNDVVLIHENEKEIYGDTAQRCYNILSAINSQYFRAAFDYANFVQCSEDTQAAWELVKDYVVYIHIKDAVYNNNENVVCGTGDGKIEILLTKAIKNGYRGFLTLEPHLVLFDALKSLELSDATDVIKTNKANTGAEGYEMQYTALLAVLEKIKI